LMGAEHNDRFLHVFPDVYTIFDNSRRLYCT
jgi:hypothetical protein